MTHDNPKLNLPKGWRLVPLNRVADIIPSNVDKKIYAHELPIRLCNYMDVYSNDYLSRAIQFSSGSVTLAEFQKFRLKQEDVIITKDSETPDDIAVPAVVIEDLGNVVCGYHLALLRPNGEITGTYLSKALQTHLCRRHFGNTANGATRYGLTQKVISRCPILLPTKQEQVKISQILTTLDQAIEKSEHIINKYEHIKTGLMQDLLTRGIDGQGNIRSEEMHEFKDSPLGKIPKEWDVKTMSDLCLVNPPKKKLADDCLVSFLAMADVSDNAKIISKTELPFAKVSSGFTSFIEDDILVAKITPCFENGKGAYAIGLKNGFGYGSTEFHVLRPKEGIFGKLVYHITTSRNFRKAGKSVMIGSAGQQRVQKQFFERYFIGFPSSLKEQKMIAKVLDEQDNLIEIEKSNLAKHLALRSALMQDLLTGKVRVDSIIDAKILKNEHQS